MSYIDGRSTTPAYSSWKNMVYRCTNLKARNFHNYGGRGIKVCDRWLSFENFLADMGQPPPGMSIERNDNDGNYEPGNCRWATKAEQSRNSRNRKLTPADVAWIRSRPGSIRQMARALGVSAPTVCLIKNGQKWREA